MVINLKSTAPLSAVFEAHKQEITAAIELSVSLSAAQMGDAAAKLFSVQDWNLPKPLKQAA